MSKVLVTGGAGYIGSHTIRKLKESGRDVLVFDNFSSGHKEAILGFEYFEGDLANKSDIKKVFDENDIDSVIHFAGSIEAGESMADPKRFFDNNVITGLNLLEGMLDHNVKKIVFSSSAAIYGEPSKNPIEEEDEKVPTNYYGLTKLMFEQILEAYDHAYGIRSVSLRYFNAAGAHPSGDIGADHKNKTHLITLIMLAALGKRDSIKVFGNDFDTPDGTGIRDYVHVCDLADAHVLAMDYLDQGSESNYFNLGNECGNSVREVIEVSKKVSGKDFKVVEEGRREGDPAKLVASSQKAKSVLGWEPQYKEITNIVKTSWSWHQKNPNGYKV